MGISMKKYSNKEGSNIRSNQQQQQQQQQSANQVRVERADSSTESELDRQLEERRDVLLSVTLRTMLLLHHNQKLQSKINALQRKTKLYLEECAAAAEEARNKDEWMSDAE